MGVRALVNGDVRQNSRTADMVFDVPALIAFISRAMTLEPGDVILTGTPAGVSPIHDGDVVSIEIEGIGTLRNPVRVLPGLIPYARGASLPLVRPSELLLYGLLPTLAELQRTRQRSDQC